MLRLEQQFSTPSTSLSLVAMGGLLLLPFFPSNPNIDRAAPLSKPMQDPSARQSPEGAGPQLDGGWTESEIARSRAQCVQVLKSVDADLEMLPQVKKGSCGAPAIVRLKSLGSKSPVAFDPPVEVNCQMAAALYQWNKSTLQPASQRKLRSGVARILGASGYVCRNVYNLPDRNLSQHAFANAIDVSAFVLKDGRIITVRKGWGPTKRDAKRQIKKTAAPVGATAPAGTITQDAASRYAAHPLRRKITKTSLTLKDAQTSVGQPRQQKPDSAVQRAKRTAAEKFLKRLHRGACGHFDTVLGPEANEAHRSHFHFDLNASRSRPYCD